MGNRGRADVDVVKRKKKKGRPSLLDLQKRSLRLRLQIQNQKPDNRSLSPNSRLKFPNSTPSSSRCTTRRNPNPQQDYPLLPVPEPDDEDDEEEDGGSGGKRKEKKLKLVLRLPSNSDGENTKRLKTDREDRGEKVERNNSPKATDSDLGMQTGLGPTTPLPDQKLLVFILDRLQKKDTYGVFSEPVDPEELPDYHEVIERPMDFGTVRTKLLSGEYANLEQFETDILLISSNAMCYNAPDTIYFRQARAIQELAKKNFENLRQESDDNEPETKTVVRRGRPPNKNKKIGRAPTDRAVSDFSADAKLANARDSIHLSNLANGLIISRSLGDMPGEPDVSNRASYGLCNTDTFGRIPQQKVATDEEYSGSARKGIQAKFGRKPTGLLEETHRNTYTQLSLSTYTHDSQMFTPLKVEKKQLVPVGLNLEYAYARSLARFAAKLGPIGWAIAAKKIQTALPAGTKFGCGWVVDSGGPTYSQPPPVITSTHLSIKSSASHCSASNADQSRLGQLQIQQTDSVVEQHSNRSAPDASASIPSNQSSSSEHLLSARASNHENDSSSSISRVAGSDTDRPKMPLENHQYLQKPHVIDGFNSSLNANVVADLGKIRPGGRQPGSFVSGAQMTHVQALAMLSRTNMNNLGKINSCITTLNPINDPKKGSWQCTTFQPKSDSVPPDLNVGFPPGSLATVVKVDSQQPDLALQL